MALFLQIFFLHHYFCLSSLSKTLIIYMPDCVMVSHSLWILRSVFLFVPMCFICFHIFLFMFHYGKFPVDVSSHSLILFLTVSNLIMSLTKKFFISSTFIFKNFSHCHLPLMISLSLLKFSTNINIFSTLSLDPSHINHSHFKVQHLEPFWFWYCQIVFFLLTMGCFLYVFVVF